MTSEEARLLRFAIKYQDWHTFSDTNPKVKRAFVSLVRQDLIETNEFKQFRLKQISNNCYAPNHSDEYNEMPGCVCSCS